MLFYNCLLLPYHWSWDCDCFCVIIIGWITNLNETMSTLLSWLKWPLNFSCRWYIYIFSCLVLFLSEYSSRRYFLSFEYLGESSLNRLVSFAVNVSDVPAVQQWCKKESFLPLLSCLILHDCPISPCQALLLTETKSNMKMYLFSLKNLTFLSSLFSNSCIYSFVMGLIDFPDLCKSVNHTLLYLSCTVQCLDK